MHVLHDQVIHALMQNGIDPSISWQIYISARKRPTKRDAPNLEGLEILKKSGFAVVYVKL